MYSQHSCHIQRKQLLLLFSLCHRPGKNFALFQKALRFLSNPFLKPCRYFKPLVLITLALAEASFIWLHICAFTALLLWIRSHRPPHHTTHQHRDNSQRQIPIFSRTLTNDLKVVLVFSIFLLFTKCLPHTNTLGHLLHNIVHNRLRLSTLFIRWALWLWKMFVDRLKAVYFMSMLSFSHYQTHFRQAFFRFSPTF